jgi:hypothetical protein
MSNLTDYFNRIGYNCKYFIGDRVSGTWNKIPFMGTVGNDSAVDRVSIHLDLPIKYSDKIHNIIFVTHKDIKLLKEIE